MNTQSAPDTPKDGVAARAAALSLFQAALSHRGGLDEGVGGAGLSKLDIRDRGFARRLAMTVLRRLGPIDRALDGRLTRPPPPVVHDLLRLGVAQLHYMNVPAFAAVSATLDLAQVDKTARPFKGLINAVLRRLSEAGPATDSADDAVPAWLLARWRAAYGREADKVALLLAQEPATDLSLKDPAAAATLAPALEAQILDGPSLRVGLRGEISTWAKDPTLIPYLEDLLSKRKYRAIGEFHIYGADADLPNVRRVVELAKQYGLYLHSHSDADAVTRHFQQDPTAKVLWAHSGFERPEKVREMLRRYPSLWCDLAFLTAHVSNGKVAPAWRELFIEFPDRFVLGSDTFTPERWHYVIENARWSRQWLSDLPPDVARKIAYENGDRLFGGAP